MQSLDHVVRACRETLRSAPAGLLTDVDGTISPIAPTPAEARVSDEIRSALSRLATKLRVVAVITGRAAANARGLVGVPGLLYVGNHGMEELANGSARWEAAVEPFRPLLSEAVAAVAHLPDRIPGVIVEDKGPTLSIHYRMATSPDEARDQIRKELRPFDERLRITAGKMVIEVRPPVDISKASAVRHIVENHALRGVVYLGDDRTDVGAFEVLRVLRQGAAEADCRTYGVAVAGAETPDAVLAAADGVVSGVDAVTTLIQRLADELEGERR